MIEDLKSKFEIQNLSFIEQCEKLQRDILHTMKSMKEPKEAPPALPPASGSLNPFNQDCDSLIQESIRQFDRKFDNLIESIGNQHKRVWPSLIQISI